jgi:hypothetical protein
MICSMLLYGLLASAVMRDTIDTALLMRELAISDGSLYEVSVEIDLPAECTQKSVLISREGIEGGHCALRLQVIKDSRVIAYTIGFYPSDGISPLNVFKFIPSEIRNDSTRDFEFTYSKVVSAKDFMLILGGIPAAKKKSFYLFGFNCVDFCLEVMRPVLQPAIGKEVVWGKKLHTPRQLRKSLIEMYLRDNTDSRILSDCPDNIR